MRVSVRVIGKMEKDFSASNRRPLRMRAQFLMNCCQGNI